MIVSNFIRIENDELTSRQWKKLLKSLTFVNPNGEVVTCYRQLLSRGYTKIPRGAWYLLPDSVRYEDKRSCPKGMKFECTVQLDDLEKDKRFEGQQKCLAQMFENEQGLIIRPPGTGKTQIALAFAAAVGTPTLVLVHTEDILQQWIEYAGEAIPGARVGVIRGQTCEVGDITIATVQTVKKFIQDKAFWKQFGCVMLDEAHHASAATFEAVLNSCPAKYRFGFTASPTRADGMHPTMKFIIGPIIHKQPFTSPVDLTVVPIKTKFYYGYRGRFDWMPMLNKLVRDEKRNQLIARIANEEVENGNSVLILSRRIEHLNRIADGINENCHVLTGNRSRKDRKEIIAGLRSGEIKIVLATQLADEALDVPRLNRLLLTFPGKHEGRIIQQIGRALRKHPEKKNAVIYDFVDKRVSVLKRQASERRRTYRKERISVKRRKAA